MSFGIAVGDLPVSTTTGESSHSSSEAGRHNRHYLKELSYHRKSMSTSASSEYEGRFNSAAEEQQQDGYATPRTSRSHLLAGLRTAPKSATTASEQVLTPPEVHIDEQGQEQMDPDLYAQLVATENYLAAQQKRLQQQLIDVQAAAGRFHGRSLNMGNQTQQQFATPPSTFQQPGALKMPGSLPLQSDGPSFTRSISPPKTTVSSLKIGPLPPPSINAFRRRPHKVSSLAVNNESPIIEPSNFSPAGTHPIRQPRGPPPLDELKARPTTKFGSYDDSKTTLRTTERYDNPRPPRPVSSSFSIPEHNIIHDSIDSNSSHEDVAIQRATVLEKNQLDFIRAWMRHRPDVPIFDPKQISMIANLLNVPEEIVWKLLEKILKTEDSHNAGKATESDEDLSRIITLGNTKQTPEIIKSSVGVHQRLRYPSSVASDNASIFSMESNSSWQSSIYDAIGAAEEFRMVLLHDADLKPVFSIARDSIDIQTFKIKLHQMLRKYSQDLLKEAQTPVERTAIQFVRKFRRKIAYQVGDKLYEDVPEPSSSQSPIFTSHYPSEGESDSAENDDDENGGDFQRMKEFLLNSLAFETFKTQLIIFLGSFSESSPNFSEPILDETVKCKTGVLDDSVTMIRPEDVRTAMQEPDLSNTETFEESEKVSADTTLPLAYYPTSNYTWIFRIGWTFSWLYSTFLKFQRPKLEAGQRRIEWQCDCGTLLYGDFRNEDTEELDELQRSLTAGETQRTTQSSGASSDAITLTTMPESASVSSTSTTLNEQIENSSNQNNAPTTLRGNLNPSTSPTPFQTPKYLALCVNKGEYYIALGEIEVSSITSDKEIFEQIRTKYLELRSFRSRALRLFLIHPTDINFVHFAVEDSHRVDIISRLHPTNYPPKAEVESHRYEYTPCPLKSAPAISANAFLHYMSCTHSEASLSQGKKWLNRLPKRLIAGLEETRRKSATDIDVEGWGIHIIEGPNLAAMTLVTSCFMVLCGVASTVYAVRMGDVSGGFAVGAFVVAAWASWMTTLFFQWKRQ